MHVNQFIIAFTSLICLGQNGKKQGNNFYALLSDVHMGWWTMGTKMAVGTQQGRGDIKQASKCLKIKKLVSMVDIYSCRLI